MNITKNLFPRPRVALLCALALILAAVGASCGSASATRTQASGAGAGASSPSNSSSPVTAAKSAAPARAASGGMRVRTSTVGRPVASGFLGLSMEYTSLARYTGESTRIDKPFANLVENLNPSGSPVLRIGGDSTDWAWWPVRGMRKPGGIRITLNSRLLAAAKALIQALHGHFILGVNLEADSKRLASVEARALLSHVGKSNVSALELGNEPELYHAFAWYTTSSGQKVYGRSGNYTPQAYDRDFANIAGGMPRFPLAGPVSGGAQWLASLRGFVDHESRVKLVTVHAYPTKKCGSTPVRATQFFQGSSLQGLARMIGGWVNIARSRHLPLRVGEMNSISCGGQGNLSPAFAPALWAVDFLPRIVKDGVQGVNFHTTPGTWQALITATHKSSGWRVKVQPEYYGLLMFAQAAPVGSRMLQIAGAAPSGVHLWAARTSTGRIDVVLINETRHARTTPISVTGSNGQAAKVLRLRAPGLYAKSGVSLGGQRISGSTGLLSGGSDATTLKPTGGRYPVKLPAYSATELEIGG